MQYKVILVSTRGAVAIPLPLCSQIHLFGRLNGVHLWLP